MNLRAGKVLACALAFAVAVPVASATAEELSEKAVTSFMEYAWSLTPSQFSKPDGTTIQIDKKKKEETMVPVDVAREVIKVGRLSAHAQVCKLEEEQRMNHISLMWHEDYKKKWTPQQMVYISQLHLTTVMLLTGKIKLVEKDGDKEVVVEEGKAPNTSCTDEQKEQVKKLIANYVNNGPHPPDKDKSAAAGGADIPVPSVTKAAAPAAAAAAAAAAQQAAPAPAATAAPAATGSTTPAADPAAAKPAAAAAPAAAAPAATAAPAAAAPKK